MSWEGRLNPGVIKGKFNAREYSRLAATTQSVVGSQLSGLFEILRSMGKNLCVLFVVLASFCTPVSAFGTCEIVLSTERNVSTRFTVALALTAAEHAVGLMGRSSLAERHGMLFDFGQEQRISMWMKDTFISLDMVFFRSDGTLAYLEQAAEPRSLRKITPPMPIRYVLEINAGASRGLNPTALVKLDMVRLKQCLSAESAAH